MICVHNISALRKIFMPVLKKFNFDFEMRHPWNKEVVVKLNSFTHKGYWWHRKKREFLTMRLFNDMIFSGDCVVEVGGHIGFITTFFAKLVGKFGKVYVFEPGSNNLPYIKKNISLSNSSELSFRIDLIESAVGESDKSAFFYEDSLTGQNNSLVCNFDGLCANQKNSFVKSSVVKCEVQVVSLSRFFQEENRIDFIKIDIEGYEWGAVQGAEELIVKFLPKLMVEVQANFNELFAFFTRLGYTMFDENKMQIKSTKQMKDNIFALHKEKHADLISSLDIR